VYQRNHRAGNASAGVAALVVVLVVVPAAAVVDAGNAVRMRGPWR
jgi:hypothetical protein